MTTDIVTQVERENKELAGIVRRHAEDVVMLPIGLLRVDHTYQRPADPAIVKMIKTEFNPLIFGTIWANERPDGHLYTIDGQHRGLAAEELFGPDYEVEVRWLQGLTVKQEAELFRLLNTRRKTVPPISLWWASLRAENPEIMSLDAVLRRHDVRVAEPHERNNIVGVLKAVRALQSIARPRMSARSRGLDYEHVDRVLKIVLTAWPGDAEALQADVLKGVSVFLRHYDEWVHDGELIKCLKRDGVINIRQRSHSLRASLVVNAAQSFAMIVRASYDHGRRQTNRLPNWDGKSE